MVASALGNLTGVALVTGAAQGIGRAVAKNFADAGAKLILIDAKSEGLKETIEFCKLSPERVWAVTLDLTNFKGIEETLREIPKRFGRLDYAVNCAAILGEMPHLLCDHPQADWEKVMNINLMAQVYLIREEIKLMLKNEPLESHLEGRENKTRGAIVNFTSYRGQHGFPLRVPYSTSKHAMIGLSRSAAVGYAKQGVRINQISPGFIDTPMAQNSAPDKKKLLDWIERAIPLDRPGKPHEIADMAMYLCSERASYMAGEVINVDGGMNAL